MDHYIRLVTFAVEGCPTPLVELFVRKAEADTRPGIPPYSTIDAYIKNHQSIVQIMLKRKYIRQDQLHLILPDPTDPPVDVNKWDISLATTMLQNIFNPLPHQEQQFIDDIRSVRNELRHKSGTAEVEDYDFKAKWNILEIAVKGLAKLVSTDCNDRITCYIDKLKTKPLSPPGQLLDVLKQWYNTDEKVIKLTKRAAVAAQRTAKTLKEVVVEGTKSKKGSVNKKVKTHDPATDEMKARFSLTMQRQINNDLKPPSEIDKIIKQFKIHNRLVIAGKGHYEAALFLIDCQGIRKERCVQVNEPDDVRHIWSDDVDLVLCVDPFGKPLRQLTKMFDKLLEKNNVIDTDARIAVLILTDEFVFREYIKDNEHELVNQVFIINNPTTETDPIQLPEHRALSTREKEPILTNMLEHSGIYIKSLHQLNFEYNVSGKAKEIFVEHKAIAIIGPEHTRNSNLAANLISPSLVDQCLVLTDPADWKYVKLGQIAILVIEDFTGHWDFDQALTTKWCQVFKLVQAAVANSKLSVIITAKAWHWEQCKDRIGSYGILEHMIELTDEDIGTTTFKIDDSSYIASSFYEDTDAPCPHVKNALLKNEECRQLPLPQSDELINSMCTVPDGTFLITKGFDLYHIDSECCQIINSLDIRVEASCFISNVICLNTQEAAVSTRFESAIQIVSLRGGMRVTRNIDIGSRYSTMAFDEWEFFVPCPDNTIHVYSDRGKMVRAIEYHPPIVEDNDKEKGFDWCNYIFVKENRIVLSCRLDSEQSRKLHCITMDGTIVWSVDVSNNYVPFITQLDAEKNVYYVKGYLTIQQIPACGEKDEVLLKSNHLVSVFCISAEQKRLYVIDNSLGMLRWYQLH